jgi:hypothetical protein
MSPFEIITTAYLVGDRFQWAKRYAPKWPTIKSSSIRADQGAKVGRMFWVEVELDLDVDPTPQGYRVGDPL